MLAAILSFIGSFVVLVAAAVCIHAIINFEEADTPKNNPERAAAATAFSMQMIAIMAIACGIKYALSS